MHPRLIAESHPRKAAAIMADSGESISFAELEAAANRAARALRALGIQNGDTVAYWIKNSLDYFILYWAGQRAGVYMVPTPTHLSPEEAAYIFNDSSAKLLITAAEINAASDFCKHANEYCPRLRHIKSIGVRIEGADSWETIIQDQDSTPIDDEQSGFHLIYSSGTTGKPKGVKLPFVGGNVTDSNFWVDRNKSRYNLTDDSVYMCPAPLYHAAPLLFSVTAQRIGSTVIILPKFSPEAALTAIEKYRVTYTQMVPTMFVRMLRMDENDRMSYDVSSLESVIHAAAPCPVHIKQQMMTWLGEIIHEYYAGSEANGSTAITPAEWLDRPGSVGRADRGILHICNEEGDELPAGENGLIYFEGASNFTYLNDPQKTKDARHPKHEEWTTIGDIGWVDDDGYLYLTDRRNFVIISGGVNIYPQEIENFLLQNTKVADVAVVGVPNEDLGEEVKAVVQPTNWSDAGAALETELIDFCREHLSHVKSPKSVDFMQALPRQENGKLYKKVIRESYWEKMPTE